MLKVCRKCNCDNSGAAMYCMSCGATLNDSYYDNAGDSFDYIKRNNVSAANNYNNVESKNKWVAFFLCLLLGFFGVHIDFMKAKSGPEYFTYVLVDYAESVH